MSRSGITSVTLPESLNTIKGWAFYNCAGLTHVILPNSVTEIGSGAFLNCDGLTSVTLSDALTEIPGFAFMRCTALPSITIHDTCLLVVPCGTLEAYTEAWGSYFTQIVEDCGQSINDIVTDDIKVYVQGGRIVVENADNETLRVFDVTGHQVVNQALPTGIYFVRIGDRITRKVAVIR